MEFFRLKYWSELPFPTSGDFPDPGIKPASIVSPLWQEDPLPPEPPGKLCLCMLLIPYPHSYIHTHFPYPHSYSHTRRWITVELVHWAPLRFKFWQCICKNVLLLSCGVWFEHFLNHSIYLLKSALIFFSPRVIASISECVTNNSQMKNLCS